VVDEIFFSRTAGKRGKAEFGGFLAHVRKSGLEPEQRPLKTELGPKMRAMTIRAPPACASAPDLDPREILLPRLVSVLEQQDSS